jgi:tyrosine-protein kinase Etk/Wzc
MTTPDTQRRWIDLALLLAARGRLLAATAAAGAVCATAVALILPPAYLARTTILPPQQSQSLAPAIMGQLGALAALGGRDLGLRNTADLYAGIVQSDSIAAELIAKFRLAERYRAKRLSDAQRTLARRTAVTVRPKEGLIDIEVQDSDPQVAAQMANAYVELLFTANARLALTEASQRRLFFEEQLRAAKANLAEAEAAMKRTQQSTGMLQLDSQAKAIVQAVSGIKAEIAAKEVQLRAMNAFAADRNPDVIVAREELAGLQSQLARMQSRGGGPGDVEIATRRMPETSLAYIRSLRELAFQEALYELLAKQYEAARIDEAKSAPVIQVVDRAQPPDHRSGPPRLLIVAAATFVCLLAAVLLLIVEDRFRHAAADPDTARKLAIFRSYLIFGSAR